MKFCNCLKRGKKKIYFFAKKEKKVPNFTTRDETALHAILLNETKHENIDFKRV